MLSSDPRCLIDNTNDDMFILYSWYNNRVVQTQNYKKYSAHASYYAVWRKNATLLSFKLYI